MKQRLCGDLKLNGFQLRSGESAKTAAVNQDLGGITGHKELRLRREGVGRKVNTNEPYQSRLQVMFRQAHKAMVILNHR